MTAATTPNPPVLIVGAGPTGLMCALELLRRGVPVRIFDKISTRSTQSRALVLHPRSMELLHLSGSAQAFAEAGQTSSHVSAFVLGRQVAGFELSGFGADDTSYPNITFLSQARTEALLEARVQDFGGRVEYGVTLAALSQDAAGVTATLESGSPGSIRRETVHASYVVGCDGAHSAVRHALSLPFVGDRYPQDFLLADVKIAGGVPEVGLRLFLGSRGVMALFPLDTPGMTRVILMRATKGSSDTDPTLAEMESLVRSYCRLPATLSNAAWIARFHLHHRGVTTYAKGRCFLAGDAAHIHSPAGGQGMNTGIQDAANLAWKLALCVNGVATTTLLDTYDEERRPVGARLLATTDRLFRAGATGSLLLAALRNAFIPLAVPFVTRIPRLRKSAFRFVSQLGIRYRRSRLNVKRDAHGPSPQPGDRMPDAPWGSGKTLYDCLTGGSFLALGIGGSDERTKSLTEALGAARAALAPVPVDSLLGTPSLLGDDLREVRRRLNINANNDLTVFIVRPDAYVLARFDGEAASAEKIAVGLGVLPWVKCPS